MGAYLPETGQSSRKNTRTTILPESESSGFTGCPSRSTAVWAPAKMEHEPNIASSAVTRRQDLKPIKSVYNVRSILRAGPGSVQPTLLQNRSRRNCAVVIPNRRAGEESVFLGSEDSARGY